MNNKGDMNFNKINVNLKFILGLTWFEWTINQL